MQYFLLKKKKDYRVILVNKTAEERSLYKNKLDFRLFRLFLSRQVESYGHSIQSKNSTWPTFIGLFCLFCLDGRVIFVLEHEFMILRRDRV